MTMSITAARNAGLGKTLAATLLASTLLARGGAAFAQTAAPPEPASAATQLGEVVVTATRRSESIQSVPISIQALDTRALDRLNVTEFQDYVKYTPSVTFQSQVPSQTTIYMRGVSSGDNANHSGPLPSVGTYLDEQPITTIGGTLDVHVYDIARIEVLPGPQGTLYGASSEAGTLRIITNKPDAKAFSAGFDAQGDKVAHGGAGYTFEGYVNQPLGEKAAIRLVGWSEHDAGYIDNVAGTRTYKTSGATITNGDRVKNDFNPVDTYGGRAALKIDLGHSWTLTPSVLAQDQRISGVFGYEPDVGALQAQRFLNDQIHDRFYQAALTLTGKIGNFDLVYSGGYFQRSIDSQSDYTDYSVAYDAYHGSGASWIDNSGNPLNNPSQYIVGKDKFKKRSNEIKIISPASDRLRIIAGLFEENQQHYIIQDYIIPGFSDSGASNPKLNYSVPGHPGTIWFTDQERIDRDAAAYTEAAFDLTKHLTILAGVRGYTYRNSLQGFFGFSKNFSSNTGQTKCFAATTYHGEPCQNLDKTVSASGETHKVNLTYKFDPRHLVYFTYSTGFRPGGVNRNGNFGPYGADTLTNYEIGFKTQWFNRRLTFNGAIYDEDWNQFQFSFLGPNSLTIIENAPSANIKGVELSGAWQATDHLSFTAGGNYNDARLSSNFCGTDQNTNQLLTRCSDASAQAVHGAQLPYTPKFKGDIIARYAFQYAGWDMHVQASGTYQTKNFPGLRTADVAALGVMPAYATADFAAGAERNGMSVEAYVKNAFDSLGQVNRYTPCTVAVCAASYNGAPRALYVVPIQPMTIGLKIGQKF